MEKCDLKEVTGKELKNWWEGLVREQAGCCSVCFASTEKYRYCVCMGWQSGYGPASEEKWVGKNGRLRPAFCPPVTPGEAEAGWWRICWKIGRQTRNSIMQCDYDIDFEMPYVTEKMAKANPELCEGDVDDTDEDIVLKWGKVVTGRNGRIKSMRLGAPVGYRSWEDLAKYVRKTARRVWRDWRDHDD